MAESTVPERPVPEGPIETPTTSYGKLRAGVHGLGREAVRAHQAARLERAMVELVAERGYGATSVAAVLARAGISRRTFYEHYANKEACFIAAYDGIISRWTTKAAAEQAAARTWRVSLRRSLSAVVDQVVADPINAHVVFIEALTSGTGALERRADAVTRFEGLARRGFEAAPGGPQLPPAMFKVLVGGVREVISNRLRQGQTHQLLVLSDPLMQWMLCYRSKVATETLGRFGARTRALEKAPGAAVLLDTPLAPAGAWLWIEDSEQPVVWLTPRERILAAVSEIVARGGREALSVAEIARTARTTHQTFNKLFASTEEALFAAWEAGARRTAAVTADASRGEPNWATAIRSGLLAQTRFLAAHPEIARIVLQELYAAGPQAVARREAPLQPLADRLEEGHRHSSRADAPPPIATEAIIGGILALMADVVVGAGPEGLPAIVADATYAALAPFIGPEAAALQATGTPEA